MPAKPPIVIERKTGASGTWGEIATLGANVTRYADTGLAAPVTYVYRVRAANPAGYSGYSNEAAATTLIPPSAPTNLTASAVSATRIQLIWEDRSDIEWEVPDRAQDWRGWHLGPDRHGAGQCRRLCRHRPGGGHRLCLSGARHQRRRRLP